MMEINEDDNMLTTKTCDSGQEIKTRTILAFGVIGFLIDFFYSIGITATQDILEATEIPSSLVLLAAAGPACLISVFFPEDPGLRGILGNFYPFHNWNAPNGTRSGAQGQAYWSVHIVTRSRQHRDGVLSFISFLWRKHGKQLRFWLRNFMSSRAFVIRR